MTEAALAITHTNDEKLMSTLSICCEVSQRQPALVYLVFPSSNTFCSFRLSSDVLSFMIVKTFVPADFLSDLLEQVSKSATLDTIYIYDTSLASSRGLILSNKITSLSTFALAYVVMERSLCENLLRQTMFLNNLKFLGITNGINEKMIMIDKVKSGLGEYCEFHQHFVLNS